MAHIRRIHQSQLTLPCRILNISTGRQLVYNVVDFEREIWEFSEVFTCAHWGWQTIFQLVEIQFRVLFCDNCDQLVEVLARNKSQTGSCIHNQLIDFDWNGHLAIRNIGHGQSPVIGIEQVVPDDTALRVGVEIIASNHNFWLLKVLANRESKQVLVNLTLLVELLYEETGTLTPGDGSETNNTIASHARESALVGGCDESHVVYALVTVCTQTYLVLRTDAPNVPTSIAYLRQHRWFLLKCLWLPVSVVVCCRARLALRSLYPEPWTTSIKNELMRLMLAAKVHCAKNLDVKEVRKVLLEEASMVAYGIVIGIDSFSWFIRV